MDTKSGPDHPDAHRESDSKVLLAQAMKTISWGWVGVEMFMQNLQVNLDTISRTSGIIKSQKVKRTRASAIRKIRYSLNRSWTPWLQFGTNPLDTKAYQVMFDHLIESMKDDIEVIGLDVPEHRSTYGMPFSIGWRNLKWAESIPEHGKGIIIGGSSHFFGPMKGYRTSGFFTSQISRS